MANVTLHRSEVEEGKLPRCCAVCGAPAVEYRRQRFTWYPGWVIWLLLLGGIPYLVVAIVLTKRMRVFFPLCPAHLGYWSRKDRWFFGSAAATVLLSISLLVLGLTLEHYRLISTNLAGFISCAMVIFIWPLWLAFVVVLMRIGIRPREITDDRITLAGVSQKFVDAVSRQR